MAEVTVQNTGDQIERALVYERVRMAYARERANTTGGWILKDGPIEAIACPFLDLFNGMLSPVWPEEESESLLSRAVTLYQRTRQGMFVSFGPASRPQPLQERLRREGFCHASSIPYMHLDLENLREHPCPRDVRIERIGDFSLFEKNDHPWLGPVGSPFRRRKLRFLRQYGEGAAPRLWQFVAWAGKRLVGAATIFAHGDEIAFFDVVVRKSYRKRGIGTRMMVEACLFARGLGMRAAGLGASGEGAGLYQKVGFSDAGSYSDFFLSQAGVAAMAGRCSKEALSGPPRHFPLAERGE